MRYSGGKYRQAAHIAPIIIDYARDAIGYYEPFLGGGSIFARVVGEVPAPEASDIHVDLIMMWQAAMGRWWHPPISISRNEYEGLRYSNPSPLRGFVGFGCSFGGKWFGGYAEEKIDSKHVNDFCKASANSVLHKSALFRRYNAIVSRLNYADLSPKPGSLIYCDPPYSDTTGYAQTDKFDHSKFWTTVRYWSSIGCCVLISEYRAPEYAQCVWEREARVSLSRKTNTPTATEKLFMVSPNSVEV